MEKEIIISLNKALNIALDKATAKFTERVNFKQSIGFVLAESVLSDTNLPPFNKSAMDGYACKKEDLGKELQVLEVIPAGKPPRFEVKSGQCSKIMTGAEVPKGADTVFMVEFSTDSKPGYVRFTGTKTNSNICLTGEDIQKGAVVLNKGTLIKPQHIAMLATVGYTSPLVYAKPTVGIISTGSELIEPDENMELSRIRNSNGHQLVSQAEEMNCTANYYGIVKDDEEVTFKIIQKATTENDVTIISGGVSVGDFDFVPSVIKKLGFEILFNKLSVKPGKHTTFAVKGSKYIIGLPGNPVSSFIQFELFAKPFLYKLIGHDYQSYFVPIVLAHDYQRKKADREEFIPITINENSQVETVKYNGSAHIHAYHEAFGILKVPQGTTRLAKGEIVHVRPL